MEPLTDLSEILYRLIYHRSFRMNFLTDKHFELNIAPEVLKDILYLDRVNLEKTAELVIRQFLGPEDSIGFQAKFNETLLLWKELFPADENGLELIYLFLESENFRLVENIPKSLGTPHLFLVFREFLLDRLPKIAKFQRLRASIAS